MIPPWFRLVLERAEHLALDNEADRTALFELVLEHLPLKQMAELGAETARYQLGTKGVHVEPALALDIVRNAMQAAMGALTGEE